MKITAQDLIKAAAGQIGYKEGKNNTNKYGAAYGWNNVPWCVIFVWWCFKQANGSELFYNGSKTASCSAVYSWAKNAGLLVNKNSVKAGDLVLFKFSSNPPDHIGIIESAGSSRLTTIEGNTSSGNSGSQANGDGVYRRYRSYDQVYAVIRPKYTGTTNNKGQEYCKVDLPVIQQGSKGNAVKTAQRLLNALGYNCGTVDGEFGSKTAAAVKKFQKAKSLSQDSIIGKNTWKALLL